MELGSPYSMVLLARHSDDICNTTYSLFWRHSKSGLFTLKSAYAAAVGRTRQPLTGQDALAGMSTSYARQNSPMWKSLWALQLKHKLKHFLWRCLLQSIPVNEQIHRRTRARNPVCECCGEAEETVEHMIFFCSNTQMVWKLAPINWDGLNDFRCNFPRWWERILQAKSRKEGEEHITLTANIIWQIWKARNQKVFKKDETDAREVVQKAHHEWLEFLDAQKHERIEHRDETSICTPPVCRPQSNHGIIRIHSDAALDPIHCRSSKAVIARDDKGNLLRAWANSDEHLGSPLMEEAVAIRMGMLMAKEARWKKVEFCSDCKTFIDMIHGRSQCDATVAVVLEDILLLKRLFNLCTFSFVPRLGNAVTHKLAKFAVSLVKNIRWEKDYPMWLLESTKNDAEVFTSFVPSLAFSS